MGLVTKGIFQSLYNLEFNANVKANKVNNEGSFESSNDRDVRLHCNIIIEIKKKERTTSHLYSH